MDNIFKKIRLELAPKNNWQEAPNQTEMAGLLGIKQQTVSRVENGGSPTYKVVKAYHDKFHVPYESLFGQGGLAVEKQNVNISNELKLTDKAIDNIRNLSPHSLEVLEAILCDEHIDMRLDSLFNILAGIDNTFGGNPANKLTKNYGLAKYMLSENHTEFMIDVIIPRLTQAFKKL